jgi:hypothetical protein
MIVHDRSVGDLERLKNRFQWEGGTMRRISWFFVMLLLLPLGCIKKPCNFEIEFLVGSGKDLMAGKFSTININLLMDESIQEQELTIRNDIDKYLFKILATYKIKSFVVDRKQIAIEITDAILKEEFFNSCATVENGPEKGETIIKFDFSGFDLLANQNVTLSFGNKKNFLSKPDINVRFLELNPGFISDGSLTATLKIYGGEKVDDIFIKYAKGRRSLF